MRYKDNSIGFSFELLKGWRHDEHNLTLTFFSRSHAPAWEWIGDGRYIQNLCGREDYAGVRDMRSHAGAWERGWNSARAY